METERNLLPLLRRCPLFEGLSEEALRDRVLPRGTLRRFSRNAALITPGETVDWFAVAASGRVQIMQLFADGTGSLMDALGSGQVLGAELLCTHSRRAPYYAIAAGEAQILRFPGSLLLEEDGGLTEGDRAAVWRALLTLLAQENMRRHYRIAILSRRGLRDRVLTWLTMQVRRRQTRTFRAPFSREELAAFLCVNRSALSHELSRMEAEGLIRFRKNEFTLLSAGESQSAWSAPE